MKAEIFLGMSAVFAGLLCLSDGTPPIKKGRSNNIPPKRISGDLYTPDEENFIIDELLSRCTNFYNRKMWEEMAEEHKRRRESGVPGFHQERSYLGLLRHFFQTMIKGGNRKKGAVPVPDTLKKKLLKQKKQTYTPEEHAFVNKELLAYSGSQLSGLKVWKEISEKLVQHFGTPGFPAVRSPHGLRVHFKKYIESPQLLPERKKQKTAVPSQSQPCEAGQDASIASGCSGTPPPPQPPTGDIMRTESDNAPQDWNEDDYEFWAEMIDELRDTEGGPEDEADVWAALIDEL